MFRHMLGTRDSMIPNERGARWNPPNVPTLYASLDRDTAIAEGDHLIALQGLPLKTVRSIHTVAVELHNVLELTDEHLLNSSVAVTTRGGVSPPQLASYEGSPSASIPPFAAGLLTGA
jgi:RES domain-containing protein